MRVIGDIWNKAKGALAATSLVLAPTTAACAQDQTPQATDHEVVVASESGAIEFLPDAHRPANLWAAENSGGFAVVIRLGTDTPEEIYSNIEPVTLAEFEKHGVTNVRFFWERGDRPTTGMSIHTDDNTYGPAGLSNILNYVLPAVRGDTFNDQVAMGRQIN